MAAATFFEQGIVVDDLAVDAATLSPILGPAASTIFALALSLAELSSSVACLLVEDLFSGLVWSQALLSLQLPITVFLQIWLTSSHKVMGRHANSLPLKATLLAIGVIVTALDIALLVGV